MLRVHRVACRTLSRQYVTGASNMKTTVQFLDAVRVRHSLTSDYQLGKLLGVSHARISNYSVGRNMMDEAMCLKIAAALSLDDPGEVLVAIAHEREKRPEVKRAWERVAKRLAASTAAVLVALGLAGSLHNPFRGAVQPAVDQTTHMRQRRRRYGAVAREWASRRYRSASGGLPPPWGLAPWPAAPACPRPSPGRRPTWAGKSRSAPCSRSIGHRPARSPRTPSAITSAIRSSASTRARAGSMPTCSLQARCILASRICSRETGAARGNGAAS